MPTYTQCAVCGHPPRTRFSRYCDKPECRAVALHNQARSPARIAAVSALKKRQWAEWKAEGINPTNDNGAGQRRGAKIAVSNRENPRRRKATAE